MKRSKPSKEKCKMNTWRRKRAPGSVNRLKKSLMLSGLRRGVILDHIKDVPCSKWSMCDLSTHLVLNVSLFHLSRQNLLGVVRFSINVLPCAAIDVLVDCKITSLGIGTSQGTLWPPYILRNVHVVSSVKEPLTSLRPWCFPVPFWWGDILGWTKS